MLNLPIPLLIVLLAVNLAAFALMGIDKACARRGAWRISEKALLGLCAVFGAFGGYAGMRVFRHKTKHKRFTIGVPAMLLVQLALLAKLVGVI